jgi:hypothetical protein
VPRAASSSHGRSSRNSTAIGVAVLGAPVGASASLRTTERISRPRFDQRRYEITIDDPGAYTKPWSGGWNIPWDAGNEPFDYLCQDNNLDPVRMVGPQE